LRRAREEMNLSQKELGEALGYGATMISAFETGRRRMKLEDLTRACIVLDKEPEFFLATEELREPPRVGLTLRAELAALPQDDLANSIEAFLDEVEAGLPTDSAVPDLQQLRPEAAAREVLKLAGVIEPAVEMEDVCDALAVPLFWRALPDSLSALVVAVGEDGFAIGVNDEHSVRRRRFSIAHELGHAVLRHEASYYLEYTVEDAWEPPGYRYLDEREANSFAAALLMDERWVRQDFASGIRDLAALADRYEVSHAAMGFRLVNLGLT
jgi:transcriptional regulator with XRE-family HTH domain